MTLKFSLLAASLLSLWSTAGCDVIPHGVLQMECHDHYFLIAADLSFTGEDPHFEAVDRTGVYAITEQYEAKCGYSVVVLPLPGRVELRASYFSCHTRSRDDEIFTFNFKLITNHDGREATYALNNTCSPSLPLSPREVTCEVNYMEVTVRGDIICPVGTKDDDWKALELAHGSTTTTTTTTTTSTTSTTSDWQVMFQREEEHLPSMSLSQARKKGYTFDLSDGRLVFRAPYGQPDSFSTEVAGVPVEVIHATVFSRHSWVVLMVDLVAACSVHEGVYNHSGSMMWETPEALYPDHNGTEIRVGLGGELVAQEVAERRGYVVEQHDGAVQIAIPRDAEEGFRKSVVMGGLHEFYVFHLYLAQILMDNQVRTAVRSHRTLITPLLPRRLFTADQTDPEERSFTVRLGNVPDDVQLTSVQLNGRDFPAPLRNASFFRVTEVRQPNNTRSYTLKVPFDHPDVIRQFSKEDAVLQYKLDINYTLTVDSETEAYYHPASVVALFTDVSPPAWDAVCTESGISFELDRRPFDFLWEMSIGSDPLTPELAAQHGYVMSNDSQSLQLGVPLFSLGYKYEAITLKGFSATFEILVKDRCTSVLETSTVKTCLFFSTEFIMCSTDGRMTVLADLSAVIPSGAILGRINLMDKKCGPEEADDTRALFSFLLNGCGSVVKLMKENVIYQNEIFFNNNHLNTNRVLVQCTYPLASLHSLFSKYRFESDTVGVGRIIFTTKPSAGTGLHRPTVEPTTAPQTTPATTKPTRKPLIYIPSYHPPAHFIKVHRAHSSAAFRKVPNRRHNMRHVKEITFNM